MKIQELFDGLFWVTTESQRELAQTFLRFQEHYESPHRPFTTRGFSREKFKRWYRRQPGRGGKFTYYTDWGGFNLPGTVLKSFQDGTFKNLTRLEKRVLRRLGTTHKKFYVIGTSSDNGHEALKHEIAHGLFYLSESYRNQVTSLIKANSRKLRALRMHLRDMGYADSVMIDELHAYVLCEEVDLNLDGLWNSNLQNLRNSLNLVFQHHHERALLEVKIRRISEETSQEVSRILEAEMWSASIGFATPSGRQSMKR